MLYQRKIAETADVIVATSMQECVNIKKVVSTVDVAVIPNGVNFDEVKRRRGNVVCFSCLGFIRKIWWVL